MPHRTNIDLNDCSPAMRQAARTLKAEGVRFEIKTIHQIKVGDLNFYPARGTIFRDGDPGARDETGLDAFLQLVRPRGGNAKADPAELTITIE